MEKKTVLLINPTIQPIGVELIKKEFHTVMAPDGQEETLIQYINQYKVDCVIARLEKITRRIFESCPTLAVVGEHGVGLDNVDVAAATDNGVIVLNVPAANYVTVAEHTIMAILALSRNLVVCDRKVRNNEWRQFRESFYPMEVNGKTLFILGMGRIGMEVARKAKAFNMRLLGYDPFVSAEDMAMVGAEKVEDILARVGEADFLSIHVPATPATTHLINTDLLSRMKKSAFVINVGRGPVVDQNALCEALKNKVIAGAFLDVMDPEPPKGDEPILQLDNVMFTPHYAGDTHEAKYRISKTLATEVTRILKGGGSPSVVNPKALGVARLYKQK